MALPAVAVEVALLAFGRLVSVGFELVVVDLRWQNLDRWTLFVVAVSLPVEREIEAALHSVLGLLLVPAAELTGKPAVAQVGVLVGEFAAAVVAVVMEDFAKHLVFVEKVELVVVVFAKAGSCMIV